MDIQTIALLVAIGIGAGILGGLVGVGGGIVIVPALVYLLQYSQKQAQGTSLGLIMLPVGILGFIHYYKYCAQQGTPIDFRVIAIIAIGFVLGSWLGSRIAVKVDQDLLKKIFAGFLLLLAIKMLFFDKQKNADKATTAQLNDTQQPPFME